MRELVLRRPLNPTTKAERLVQLNPSLAMTTLRSASSPGRRTSLQQWQGSRRAIALVKRDLVGPDAELVDSSRDGLRLLVVERLAASLDVPAIAEREMGSDVLAAAELASAGATWRILARSSSRVPAFLRALREAEEAMEKREGAAIPRYARVADDASAEARATLSPRERSVLAHADKLGYFDQPRKAGVEELGRALRMPPSTALYHLRAAQRKLVKDAVRG